MNYSKPFLIIYLLILSFLISCSKVAYQNETVPNTSKVQASESETRKIEASIISNSNLTPTKPIVYDILGNSAKLSEKEYKSMKKWQKDIQMFSSENPGLIYLNGQKGEKAVCLTFDDGPDNINTPKILDILKKYNVKGSFFFIGNKLTTFKSIVKRTYSEGNLVLNHSWSHPELTRKNSADVVKEITSTENKIFEIIGKKPAIIRPPYGEIDKNVLAILNQNNYKAVIWSIDTLDWSQKESPNIVKNVLDNVRPGDIVLMHCNEDKKATVAALPKIIEGLSEKGYKFEDLGEMLGIKPYKD